MIIITLLLFGLYFPSIHFNQIDISPNFFLISILIFSVYNNDYKVILLGFFFGLINDILLSTYYHGLLTIIFTFFSYLLFRANIHKNRTLINPLNITLLYITIFLLYLTRYEDSYFFYIIFSSINTFLSFIVLILFDNFFEISKKYAKK